MSLATRGGGWGGVLQNLSHVGEPRGSADPTPPLMGAIELAIAVGVTYFSAAQLSLALFAEPGGVVLFWPAAGISSGVLIALGRDARLPVIGGAMVATIAASL